MKIDEARKIVEAELGHKNFRVYNETIMGKRFGYWIEINGEDVFQSYRLDTLMKNFQDSQDWNRNL